MYRMACPISKNLNQNGHRCPFYINMCRREDRGEYYECK